LIFGLQSELGLEVRGWLDAAKLRREAELNKFQHRDWDLSGTVNYPVPYDYYLRDYRHLLMRLDLKRSSLTGPYTADISIWEILYVEGYHSNDADDVRQYYYTLSRPVALSLEYRNGKFVITDTAYGPFQLESGWKKDQGA
jgi:hypothetical protein